MPYHAWVTAAGQAALEQLRTEMRLRLATKLVLAARIVKLHDKQCMNSNGGVVVLHVFQTAGTGKFVCVLDTCVPYVII